MDWMKIRAALLTLLICSVIPAPKVSAAINVIFRDAKLCDNGLCLRGTLIQNAQTTVEFRGRVAQKAKTGRAQFLLVGETHGGQLIRYALGVDVQGDYSEIVEIKRIPPAPSALEWRLERFTFSPSN